MGPEGIAVPAELQAAGWPIGLALAALLVVHRASEARRRSSLNLALHELRRPLQELVLASSGLAASGVGGRPYDARRSRRPRSSRQRGPSTIRPSPDRVPRSRAGRRRAVAGRCRRIPSLARAALAGRSGARHGGPGARRAGARQPDPQRDPPRWPSRPSGGVLVRGRREDLGRRQRTRHAAPRRRRDPRHGHGLRIVSAIAAEHGGRFLLRTGPTGTTATLELPFAPRPAVASAARPSRFPPAPALMRDRLQEGGQVAGPSG